jgi:dihydrofolate reductase
MHVFLIAAITADGFIAEATDQISTSWTSKEDKKWFNQRTKEAGVIVMGMSTFKTIGRPLPGRLNVVYTRSGESNEYPQSPDLLFTNLSPAELLADLEKKDFQEVAICGGSSIYAQFMKAKCLDTLYLTIEPVVFGKGIPLFGGDPDVHSNLKLKKTTPFSEQTLLLEYSVVK